MPIRLFNTLTRKKETFKPLKKGRVGLYTCGPTMYNYVHIGNLRTYVFQDVLKRVLGQNGFTVKHIMNTTDVDDKTIKASKEAVKTLQEFTRGYEKAFLEDLRKLNINSPTVLSRATEHIDEMIRLTAVLLKKGYAYKKDGSVYFDISKFKPYGKLARLNLKGMKAGARVDVDEYAKENAEDFVLWKGKKEGEPFWKAPFGDGRPGWHIECSAMSMQYLGKSFDLHTGGVDLIFPHHENEIAQSEAATGKKFVRYWVHGEHLLVNGQRMAKSLKNFFTLRDIEAREFDPLDFRYLALSSHYRSKLNFTWESLAAAEQAFRRLRGFMEEISQKKARKTKTISLEKYRKGFAEALADDLNTPTALSIVWNLVKDYRKKSETFDPKRVRALMLDFDKSFGFGLKDAVKKGIPPEISELAERRKILRREKKWDEADAIRSTLTARGYTIDDTPEGPRLKKN